jgi:Bifunctional DNA primase/polymerase, N-terminal
LTGRRSRITVLDIDSMDEKIAADAIGRHGQPAVVVRTASGKCHLLYRYNGERRRIRPWPDRPIDILGDNGFAIGAPSELAKGQYQIVHGCLDDLDRLVPMVGIEPPETPVIVEAKSDAQPTIPHGRRNNELWRYCMRQAHLCADRVELVDMARAYNDHLAFLKAHNGPWATFLCANGLTKDLGWDRHRLADARRRLIELGYVIQIRRATQGHPALFQWAD